MRSTMETVQIVIDRALLDAADKAARRKKQNRSELVREALREHLHRLEVQRKEEQDRLGYEKHPQQGSELVWEREASWPAE